MRLDPLEQGRDVEDDRKHRADELDFRWRIARHERAHHLERRVLDFAAEGLECGHEDAGHAVQTTDDA